MIYRVIKQLITLGRTEGLRDKIDVLFVAGSLTEEEHTELIALLDAEE
jgi:hypothetical protein